MISKNTAQLIQDELNIISNVFGEFQKKTKLVCPEGCGKCCVTPDISCAPYELLPLAFYLLENNLAHEYLDKAISHKGKSCMLLKSTDEGLQKATCLNYEHRPFVCRAFGVAARHTKHSSAEYSVCKVLKDKDEYQKLSALNLMENEIAFIDVWKRRLCVLDPNLLEEEIPINEALAVILEKVLLWDQYNPKF